jgi:DNA-binding transcriptional LysR family regulator
MSDAREIGWRKINGIAAIRNKHIMCVRIGCAYPSIARQCDESDGRLGLRPPRDLNARNCLDYNYSRTRGEWAFTGRDGKKEVISVVGRIRANNGDVLRALALKEQGIALQPRFIIDDDLKEGRLIPLLSTSGQ